MIGSVRTGWGLSSRQEAAARIRSQRPAELVDGNLIMWLVEQLMRVA